MKLKSMSMPMMLNSGKKKRCKGLIEPGKPGTRKHKVTAMRGGEGETLTDHCPLALTN